MRADAVDRVNRRYIARNRQVEDALEAATSGDMSPCEGLAEAVSKPFVACEGLEQYAEAALVEVADEYMTFCGT